MESYFAFLRGINVGGNRVIKMESLKNLFQDLGFQNIETYIQSGNFFFQCKAIATEKIAQKISTAIADKFNFDVPVIVLEEKDLETLLSENPFCNNAKKDVAFFHVTLLSHTPLKADALKTSSLTFLPDEFFLKNKTIYLYCPNQYHKTKLTNSFFEKHLKANATTRNWKTLNAMLTFKEK